MSLTLDLFGKLFRSEPPTPVPGQTLALVPLEFRHPNANREIVLEGCVVAYVFQRGRRRTIGFTVGPEGLVVRAPGSAALRDVESALREKAGWIVRKLGEMRARGQRMASARIEWCDGVVLPFLGEPLQMVLDPACVPGVAGAVLGDAAPGGAQVRCLRIGLAHGASELQIRDAVQAWLVQQAHRIFMERLAFFAPQLGVQWRSLRLSNASTRWGSASVNGSIRLNWRLVHFRPTVLDYVVVHELSHLRFMDHSPRFWSTVASVLPDYAELRRQLKSEVVPVY